MQSVPTTTNVVSSNPVHGEVIKFVSDLQQVGGFLRVLRFPPSRKTVTDCHDITEILLKVVLNTMTPPL